MLRIGSGSRAALYVGTHHAMEHFTAPLLLKAADELCRSIRDGRYIYGIDPSFPDRARTLYIVPMLNPDGAELQINGADPMNPLYPRLVKMNGSDDFSRWQANGRGVDLNHNYNAGFREYKRIEEEAGIRGGAPTRYSGMYPESEPECSALCSFVRRTGIMKLFSFHTQGEEIYYDYNGYAPPGAVSIAKRCERISGYRLAQPEGMASYGGLKDWYILEYDRPSFTVECGKGENPLPYTDLKPVYNRLRELLMTAWV